jgi:hypothetical protein
MQVLKARYTTAQVSSVALDFMKTGGIEHGFGDYFKHTSFAAAGPTNITTEAFLSTLAGFIALDWMNSGRRRTLSTCTCFSAGSICQASFPQSPVNFL